MLGSDDLGGLSRRGVLRAAGAAAGAATVSGVVAGEGSVEVNVGIDPGASATVRRARGRAESVKTTLDFGDIGTTVVGRFSAEAREALAKNPNVRYVERNGEMEKLAETLPWGIDRVDADVLHANGDTGGGATVAVLDTGIDEDHPDLKANVVGGKAFETECGAESGGCRYGAEGYNGNDCNYAWSDDDDHGSHVSGTTDGVDNSKGVIGVATGADLLAGKVLTGCGSGTYSAIASGIKWATDQGADVINMSLGGDSGSSTLKDACQYAYDNNVVTVAAAGNSGPCSDCVGYPAAYSTVLAVSATTPSDTLAGYSSTGPEVEIAAPGGANDGDDSTSILSTIPPESDDSGSPDGYAYFVGTSMATPHVAGAAAQVKAETDLSDNQQIIDRLKSTAEDVGLASNESGAGLLDAEAAVGSSSGGNNAPAVDSLSATEVETSDSDAEFDASWDVSDADGNLSSVELTLTQDSDGSTEDSTTVSVSGSSASGTTRLVAAGDDGSGNGYTVEAVVSDDGGVTDSVTTAVDETESTSSAPTVDSHAVSTRQSGPWTRVTTDWSVSDDDGDLDSVVVAIEDGSGNTLASTTVDVSGSTASGSTELKSRSTPSTSVVTVSDTAGNSDTSSKSV